jgi:hypothetical protein
MKSATRADHESRLNDERRRAERGKHVVVLMLNHLLQMGYAGSVDALQSESGLLLSQYEPADNVDLVSVLQEWEDYYEMRFQRRPKVVRKLSAYSDKVDPHGAKVREGESLARCSLAPQQPAAAMRLVSRDLAHCAFASCHSFLRFCFPLRARGGRSRRQSAPAAAARTPPSPRCTAPARLFQPTISTTLRTLQQ